jgi:hypothetical protein
VTKPDFTAQLRKLASEDGILEQPYDLVKSWKSARVGLEAVESILRFMEDNPDLDFGTPGELVHFVERFYRHGYEEELRQSLARKPTAHTVWMLNRLINGARSLSERQKYVGEMQQAKASGHADEQALQRIDHYLNRLSAHKRGDAYDL